MHFDLPKPLHGWREFAGEVGIIVLGVLIALGAEALFQSWQWHRRADEGRERLRAEVGHAFVVAEERVATEQCIDEQLGKIEDAVLASGTSMRSLPLYRESGEANIAYVFRTPSRIWPDSAWQSVIAEGLLAHLKPDERKWLPVHYSEMTRLDLLNTEENAAVGDLAALWKPLPLDAQTKSSFVRVIEQERHRNQAFASISRQMMKMIRDLGYTPSNADRRKWLEDSGTINFCRSHGFIAPENERP
ncbi:MAG: hypothetical protein V4499_01035 [Pseudomonadota bacterium]